MKAGFLKIIILKNTALRHFLVWGLTHVPNWLSPRKPRGALVGVSCSPAGIKGYGSMHPLWVLCFLSVTGSPRDASQEVCPSVVTEPSDWGVAAKIQPQITQVKNVFWNQTWIWLRNQTDYCKGIRIVTLPSTSNALQQYFIQNSPCCLDPLWVLAQPF